ncbi:MAG: penicillin-binding protein activator LpoB [Polyangiaceae bacterium]|nr:penicillin-binding protein activator LpoB [Polyangiaceae bacterium]MCW5789156.1 penicillin-binding protein activator LpoB [Polyangiaceae bacterium]
MILRRAPWLTLLASALLLQAACGSPTPVRGEEVAGLDDEAFSTGLDRRDLARLLEQNMAALQESAVLKRWQQEDRPTLTVLPLRNETSEHVDSALESLVSDIETRLINAGHVRVVSHERQASLIEEVRRQHSDAFDPSQIARWGRQLGARYFITGKVFSSDERKEDERRVQYWLFLQVLDAETGEVLFQNKVSVTKALVN